ncbi:MAG TPA: glycerate kinase [Tissierellia bacterium]|nr:glycerate kinase [Tissierellia bacterium]
MKKILVLSDSFKGTLSSRDIAKIAKERLRSFFPEAEVIAIPIADGGEGTVDTFLEVLSGEKITRSVTGPDHRQIEASYALFQDTAVIEMAAAAGLPLVSQARPDITTTYGVGQLILDSIERGAKKIILGLGGSATNDAGCGCVSALGGSFYNARGEAFLPTGNTLFEIERFDVSAIDLRGAELLVMCDIDHPLYGPEGAAYVFAPQKGADPEMVELLDQGLRSLHGVIRRQLSIDVSALPGAGAAGGMGAGMVAFLGGRLRPGIDLILDLIDFDELIRDADLILTGEGKLDGQSLRGKVVSGVARRAKDQAVPVIALVGQLGADVAADYPPGVSAVFVTNRYGLSFEEITQREAGDDYRAALDDVLRLIKLRNSNRLD